MSRRRMEEKNLKKIQRLLNCSEYILYNYYQSSSEDTSIPDLNFKELESKLMKTWNDCIEK